MEGVLLPALPECQFRLVSIDFHSPLRPFLFLPLARARDLLYDLLLNVASLATSLKMPRLNASVLKVGRRGGRRVGEQAKSFS